MTQLSSRPNINILSESDIDTLLTSVKLGRCVLFVGAGFSIGAHSRTGPILSTSDLEKKLKEILDEPEDSSLIFDELAEDIEQSGQGDLLREALLNHLTCTEHLEHHEIIINHEWRSIYTTNFDNVCEAASVGRRKQLHPISRLKDLEVGILDRTPLVYLHGRALDLTTRPEAPHLVLSLSSFLKRSNKNNPLFQRLQSDITNAERILFIGYSAHDEAIRELLRERPETRDKVTFVVRNDEPERSLRHLSRYGTILPIGTNGLSDRLSEFTVDEDRLTRPSMIYEIKHSPTGPLSENELLETLISGKFPSGSYSHYLETSEGALSIPERSATASILAAQSDHLNRFIVVGAAGSGKSFCLHQIGLGFARRGYRAFLVRRMDPMVQSELISVLENEKKCVILFDDASRHLNEFSQVCRELASSQRVVASFDTVYFSQRFQPISKIINGAHRVTELDALTDEEVVATDALLERFGLWGHLDNWQGPTAEFITKRCEREIRALLAYLYRHGVVGQRLDGLFQNLVGEDPEVLKGILALLFTGLARGQETFSPRDVLDWIDVKEHVVRQALLSKPFSDPFVSNGVLRAPQSRALCAFLMQSDVFRSIDIVPVFMKMMISFDNASVYNRNARQLVIECMKYRFVREIFFGREDFGEAMNRFYTQLSEKASFRENDQFWLQFGISNDMLHQYELAYKKYGTSLRMGKERGEDYTTKQVENRIARLLFNPNALDEIGINVNEAMRQATDILLQSLNESDERELVYPFRAAEPLNLLLNRKSDFISRENIARSQQVYSLMSSRVDELNSYRMRKGEKRKLREDVQQLYYTLQALSI